MVSLTQLQDVPSENLFLLVGSPGSGKSAFCQQTVLQNLALDRPIIYVTTKYGPSKVERALTEQGLQEVAPGLLTFVDAYNETVGVSVTDRLDTAYADCNNLSSIDIAITKSQEQIGRKNILLIFDSLTSPYLFSGPEILRFMAQTLSRFTARGNAIMACMDEGCGKSEDLVAMMSFSSGVITLRTEADTRLFDVVKHPRIAPTTIEVPVTVSRPPAIGFYFDIDYVQREAMMMIKGADIGLRPRMGDLINIAWRDLIFWSGMLWDPKRFPLMMYESTKASENPSNTYPLFPWRVKLLFKFMPKSYSTVRDMKKLISLFTRTGVDKFGMGTIEYLDDVSRTNEHYLRLHEFYECWGLENVGASLGLMRPAMLAGSLKGLEQLKGLERDWNVVETKCLGLGDPWCELKLVPGEIDGLRDTLAKESAVIEVVDTRLMDHLLAFLLRGKPLMERPTSGSGVHIHEVQHVTCVPLVSERLQMVFRMGGARTGKLLGERLLDAGLREAEAIKRVLDLMEHCKVGQVTLGDTIRMTENCERFGIKTENPSCYFTTGFLNGFFAAVTNQHVKETRCIATGDPYCEWEFQ